MIVPRRHIFPLIVLGLFALVAMAAVFLHAPKEVIVTRTATGWMPQKVTIDQGDVIIFRTSTSDAFWPASDFHPSHQLYPAFDSMRPVPPGQQWSFTFSKAGVWTLHDHLKPEYKGIIIVNNIYGQAQYNCRSHDPDLAVLCWQSKIMTAVKKGGLSRAYEVFDSLYANEPAFRESCHDITHVLGSETYAIFSNDHKATDRPENSYCGYGFYHGFIESMLFTEGMSYTTARQYCEALRGESDDSIAGPCFHGIGHAVFDSLDSSVWGHADKMAARAVATCEKILTNEPDRIQCTDGVFNALGNAISSSDYSLSNANTDIIPLCKAQKRQYQPGCIIQAGISYIRYKNMGREEALRFVQDLGPTLAPSGILTYIDNEVLRSISNFDAAAFKDTCASLKTEYQQSCISGVISALRNLGQPETEYVTMFRFCDLFAPGTARSGCYQNAVSQTGRLNRDSAAYLSACKAIKDVNIPGLCDVPKVPTNKGLVPPSRL